MSTEVGLLISIPNFLVKKYRGINIGNLVSPIERFNDLCTKRINKIFYESDTNVHVHKKREEQPTAEEKSSHDLEDLRKKAEIEDLRNEVKSGIKALQEGLKLCKDIKAERYYNKELVDLERDINEIESNINNIDNESLKNTLKKIDETKNTIRTITEKSSKKAEQETFAELVLEFFSKEGFDIEVDSLDEEIFSITATSKERTLKVLIDEDMNVMADFSEGYVNLYNGKCEEDTNEFIETLKKMGCKVKVKNYERKQPTKRDGTEENMYGQKYREARRNS
jgi:hypothetical protein